MGGYTVKYVTLLEIFLLPHNIISIFRMAGGINRLYKKEEMHIYCGAECNLYLLMKQSTSNFANIIIGGPLID